MDTTISPADLAAVMNKNDSWGNGGCWWIILLFICLFNGGGFGWGNNGLAAADVLSSDDLQRAVNLQAIQDGQRAIQSEVQRVAYEVGGVVKDSAYNNLGEIRDVQSAVANDHAVTNTNINSGFTNVQTTLCGLGKQISENKYEGALNTAAINANIDAKFAAMEKSQLEAQIAAQQSQINELQLQTKFCGIPRINPYAYGVYPNFGGVSFGTAFN